MDNLITIFRWIIGMAPILAIPLFAAISTVLFIKDGITSKKEGRHRKTVYTVLFIVSISILGLVIVIGTFLFIIADLFMRSM